jgi:nicotinamidase-related amidase
MALLVYDMQVGICSQIKWGSEIMTRISRLLAVARAMGMRVAFTRHLSLPKAWMGVRNFGWLWLGSKEAGIAPGAKIFLGPDGAGDRVNFRE